MEPLSVTPAASDIQTDYMKLLVTQLQNQDPLEPLDNNEMASQLAQLSELQQLETMNASFAKVLASIERSYANSLLGKEVSFMPQSQTISSDAQSGKVQEVYNDVDGEVLLTVGKEIVGLEDIISVKN